MRLLFIFIIVSLLLFHPASVFAQAAPSQSWTCLKSELIPSDGVIKVKLSTDPNKLFTRNKDVYIVECLDTPSDRVCSTGTAQGDEVIYQGDENLNKMRSLYGYQFRNLYKEDGKTPEKNPTKSNISGRISTTIWESLLNADAIRKFYGVSLIQPDENLGTGNDPSLKQGSFEETLGRGGNSDCVGIKWVMPTATPTPIPTAVPTQIRNEPAQAPPPEPQPTFRERTIRVDDPYGRVFDAVSLEPISGAKVTLLKKRADGSFTPLLPRETANAVINPRTTRADGKYVYLVTSGVYRVAVEIPSHTFPFVPSLLNPNYKNAYYEIYYGDGYTGIDIVEEGTVEHRDIPVVPKGEPYQTSVSLLGYITELNKSRGIYNVSGRVSHPLTDIEILGENVNTKIQTRTLIRTKADNWGLFSATLDVASLRPDEIVGFAKMTKVDLTKTTAQSPLQRFFSNIFFVSAQTSEKKPVPLVTFARIDHILNSLEGYAYNNKSLLPGASVLISLPGAKKPFYQTKADNKGYFAIASSHLPFLKFLISYRSVTGEITSVSPRTFIAQNLAFLKSKKINLNVYASEKTGTTVKPTSSFFPSPATKTKVSNITGDSSPVVNNEMLIVIITIILLVSITGALGYFLYIKKRQNLQRYQ